MEVLDSGWYRLGCSLDTRYQAADLEAVDAAYSELDENFLCVIRSGDGCAF